MHEQGKAYFGNMMVFTFYFIIFVDVCVDMKIDGVCHEIQEIFGMLQMKTLYSHQFVKILFLFPIDFQQKV